MGRKSRISRWLRPVSGNPHRALYIFCNSTFISTLRAVRDHEQIANHRRNVNRRANDGRLKNDREEIDVFVQLIFKYFIFGATIELRI